MCASARSVSDNRRMINYAEVTFKPRLFDGSDPVNYRLVEPITKKLNLYAE